MDRPLTFATVRLTGCVPEASAFGVASAVRHTGCESLENRSATKSSAIEPEERRIVERAGLQPFVGIESEFRGTKTPSSRATPPSLTPTRVRRRVARLHTLASECTSSNDFPSCGGVSSRPRAGRSLAVSHWSRRASPPLISDRPGDPFAELAVPGRHPFLQPSRRIEPRSSSAEVDSVRTGSPDASRLGLEIGANGRRQAGGAEVGCGRSGGGAAVVPGDDPGTPGGRRQRFFQLGDARRGPP